VDRPKGWPCPPRRACTTFFDVRNPKRVRDRGPTHQKLRLKARRTDRQGTASDRLRAGGLGWQQRWTNRRKGWHGTRRWQHQRWVGPARRDDRRRWQHRSRSTERGSFEPMWRHIGATTEYRPTNPEGERSPWKERATARWQRRRSQRTRWRSKAPRSRVAEQTTGNGVGRGGTTTRGQRPQRCGTAASGGTSSRGVKAQSGKRPTGQTSIAHQIYQVGPAFGRRKSGRRSWKRCEPLPVPGCNKPGTHSRRKPSGWCETTGTERVDRSGIRPAEGGGNAIGSGRERAMSEEGTPSSESHERQVRRTQATAGQALRIGSGALKARRRS